MIERVRKEEEGERERENEQCTLKQDLHMSPAKAPCISNTNGYTISQTNSVLEEK